jgi:3-keto-disaccharide hydrolase
MEWTELIDPDLARWTIENAPAAHFRVVDDVLVVREPEGWLRSDRRYADFECRTEFRFLTDDADSGLFVRVASDVAFRRGWPNRSYQVQIRNPLGPSPYPPVGDLFRHGMASGPTDYDEPLARAVCLPTGAWQLLTVRVAGDTLSVALNGTAITRATGLRNETGFIGIQGETGVLEFRSLRIRTPG